MWDGFVTMMQTHGFPMRGDDAESRAASLVAMAREQGEVFAVSEGLMDHDEALAQWRFLHVTLEKRCFPELWGLRSHL